MSHHKPIWAAISVAILIAIGFGSMALMPINRGGGPGFDEFAVGYLIGAIFGQAVAASAWMALGPGSIYLRAPLSMLARGSRLGTRQPTPSRPPR